MADPRLAFLETLYTPLVSDTMDSLGIEGYVLPHEIQSIFPDPHLKVAGYAYPCRVIPTDEYVEIHTLLAMVDSIPADSIVVVAADSDIDAALWGGLMSTKAQKRGARAAVVNGGVRDIEQVKNLNFPVFGTYRCVKDIRKRGYMAEYGSKVVINGIEIGSQDIIFADANGVVVIPQKKINEVINLLAERSLRERKTEEGLAKGQSAQELFEHFGTF
jgi:4-hydroxy-4-methyl-2-oxoglutarate aldolase